MCSQNLDDYSVQPWAASTPRFKRASVDSRERNRWHGGEDWRCNRERTVTRGYVIACSFSPLSSSSYHSASPEVPRGGWLYGNPWKKLQRFSLYGSWDSFSPLPSLWQLQQIKPTITTHTVFAQRSSGAGWCVCPGDVPAPTCIHLPPAIPQFPGSNPRSF